MAKSARQKEKLLRILEILENKSDDNHYISTKAIIDELSQYEIEAERKSIYDDILVLQNMGYDIRQTKGREGGYCLASRKFDRSEILPLVDAVSSSRFITEKKSRELIKKLEGFLSVYDACDLNREVHVTNRIKSDNESIYYVVDSISRGISEKKKITFLYCEWTVNKQLLPRRNGDKYLISPISLCWDDEKYYLIGFDESSKEIRHYRCDKIKNVDLTKEMISDIPEIKNFDTAQYYNKTFGMYAGKEEAVTIVFPENLCGIMIDRFGKEPTMRNEETGKYSIRVSINVSPQFFGWITGLGDKVKIKSPQYVVDEYTEYIKNILNKY